MLCVVWNSVLIDVLIQKYHKCRNGNRSLGCSQWFVMIISATRSFFFSWCARSIPISASLSSWILQALNLLFAETIYILGGASESVINGWQFLDLIAFGVGRRDRCIFVWNIVIEGCGDWVYRRHDLSIQCFWVSLSLSFVVVETIVDHCFLLMYMFINEWIDILTQCDGTNDTFVCGEKCVFLVCMVVISL